MGVIYVLLILEDVSSRSTSVTCNDVICISCIRIWILAHGTDLCNIWMNAHGTYICYI